MANDSSLAGGSAQFAFDIESQKGVMSLLAAIRASEISPEEKNDLRDLVLLYTNGGHDNSVRITIQQKVAAFGIKPLPSAVPVTAPSGFGSSRPSPSFSISEPVPAAAAPEPAPAAPTSAPEPTPAPAPVVEPAPVLTPEPVAAPVSVVQEPQPALVVETPASAPIAPAPNPEPIPAVTPTPVAQPEPQLVSAPEPTPAPTPATTPASTAAPAGYNPDAALQRIREIKSLVNDKVGNPVNLVNIDNVVGREYMAALLDAMKKINSGSSAISAMQRLETAYVAVEKTLKENGTEPKKKTPVKSEAPAPEPTPAPAPNPEPIPAVTPTPVAQPEPQPVSVTEITQPEPQPAPAPEPQPQPVSAPEPTPEPESEEVPAEVSASEPEVDTETDYDPSDPHEVVLHDRQEKIAQSISGYEMPAEPESVQTISVAPAGAPAPIPGKRSEEEVESAWGPATDTLKPQVSAGKVSSLADTKDKLRSPDELLSPSDIASSSVNGDPLFTKEVDEGLQQLLSEWSLFKKSGLFGTGPKGREHPLFKKVATLQIPLLLAGRFEGATQEIKQSITDYMNGWRYEQGIIYEQGETFEHYLRRVIRHIVDLQKKKH